MATVGPLKDAVCGASLLHVGVCTGSGLVYSFDETGFHCDRDGWEQSVVSQLVDDSLSDSSFCLALEQHDRECQSNPLIAQYDDPSESALQTFHWSNNCFDYVVDFYRSLLPYAPSSADKLSFCALAVAPAIFAAEHHYTTGYT